MVFTNIFSKRDYETFKSIISSWIYFFKKEGIYNWFMTNICRNYFLPCPYALSGDDSQLPCCVPDQKSCDKYTQKYKTELKKN